jgi:uncharacterized membrane protein
MSSGSETRQDGNGRGRWSNDAVQSAMGTVLRAGVITAAVLVAAGGLHLLLLRGDTPVHFGTFVGAVPWLRDPAQIVRGAVALRPAGLIQLGLLVLVLTPVARVVFSAIAFGVQRDRLYVVLTGIVLVVLTLSLTGHTP